MERFAGEEVVGRRAAEAEAGHAEHEVDRAPAVVADERQVVAGALVAVDALLAVVDDLLQLDRRIRRIANAVAGHASASGILRVDLAVLLPERLLAEDR